MLFAAIFLLLSMSPARHVDKKDLSSPPAQPIAAQPAAKPAEDPQPEKAAEATTPPPQPQGCDAYRPIINKYAWNTRIAFAVMRAENEGCDPNETSPPNVNGTIDRGLFQVNSVHADKVGSLNDLYDPGTNVAVAYQIYLERQRLTGNGWQAWSTYKSGRYLKFLR